MQLRGPIAARYENLVLDLPVGLHPRHHRIHRRVRWADILSGLDPVQHCAQFRVQLGALHSDQLRSLSASQIKGLTSAQLNALSSDQLNLLTTDQMQALASTQVATLSSAQVGALDSSHLAALTSGQIRALTTKDIAALDSTDMAALGSAQVAALTADQLRAVDTADLIGLHTDAISALTSAQLSGLTTGQLNALGSDQMQALGSAQLRGLGTAQLAALASDPAARFNHPRWWVERLQRDWPAQWQAVLEADQQRAPLTLRVNARRGSAEAYVARLAEAGLAAQALPGTQAVVLAQPVPVTQLPGFAEGEVSVQDAAARWGFWHLGQFSRDYKRQFGELPSQTLKQR